MPSNTCGVHGYRYKSVWPRERRVKAQLDSEDAEEEGGVDLETAEEGAAGDCKSGGQTQWTDVGDVATRTGESEAGTWKRNCK